MIGRKRTFLSRKLSRNSKWLFGDTAKSGRGFTPTRAVKGRSGGARKSNYSRAKRR